MPGTLYLVATPIGNLQDITLRALETLRTVDLIACEDTRHTRNLLNHFRISNKTVSYHEHNEQERAEEFVDRLAAGENIAVVSDAGTPGICDPGFRIVQRASESGVKVVPIPGAAAFVSGVIVSGLPTDSVFFGGFLPSKKGERRKRLEEVRDIPATLLFYEAPHRLSASIGDCLAVLGDRTASVSRELTKMHEETVRGTLSFLFDHFQKAKVKGEIVISIDRAGETVEAVSSPTSIEEIVRGYELAGLDHKAALKKTAKDLGISKSEAYRMLLPKDK
ncbi:MAG: 16S rRNA (cytidine(1402)-2'-O)-methyltransferase [Pyrinomonadaceae bacterium]